jgi:hypothetical protein
MPRGKAKPKKEPSKLLQAMQFLSVCQKNEADNDSQMYCSLQNGLAVAFDGILAAGTYIDEQLDACPHTHQMILALSRCGDTRAITQHQDRLQVRSDEFEAFVPCCKRERLTAVNPDARTVAVSESLISAIETVAPLCSEKGDIIEAISIQVNTNSVLATNREMIIEAWHGCNLPFGEMLIPLACAKALSKVKKKVVGIGLKPNVAALFPAGKDQNLHDNLTFWFEDNSWLRTNLFKNRWRDKAFNLPIPTNQARPIPKSVFETVAKVLPFSEDGKVYFSEGKVSSHNLSQTGAGYSLPVSEGPTNKVYKGKNFLLAGKHAVSINELERFTMFYGATTRCAVWHDTLLKYGKQV